MTDFDLPDLADVDPERFAKIVKSTPDSQIREVMRSDLRGTILDAVFSRMPSLFRADRAGATRTVIHWTVGDRPDGGADTYEIVIENGACAVTPTPERDPKLSLAMGPVEFLKVASGTGNPVMMFLTGKLKATGDLGLAANIANLFDIPKV